MARQTRRSRRGGGAAGKAAEREKIGVIDQMPWRIPVNTDRPTEPLDEEGVQAIHEGAMRILEEIGIEFYHDGAKEIFKEAGCIVKGDNVRMDREFIMEMIGKAPEQFTITPRKPKHEIVVGGKYPIRKRQLSTELLGSGAGPENSRYPRDVREFLQAYPVFQLHPLCGRLPGRASGYSRQHPPFGRDV